jgi:RHS repeat-associated protein
MANKSPHSLSLAAAFCFLVASTGSFAATFPGNADLTVSDPIGSLSWNNSANALTVQCWFEISVPSGTNLTQNMTILVNGTSGSESQYAYLMRFNIYNGCVEFVTQGSSGGYTNTLIQQPYLNRWYHLAVVRQGLAFTGYVDGLQAFSGTATVGNSGTTAGVSVGGWGQGDYLFGDVQEVSIYQNALAQDFIAQYMYNSQPTNDPTLGLTGYYPIGFSTSGTSSLANLAPGGSASSASTSGPVTFPETDLAGEQSAFDAWRNGGRNAIAPVSGDFSWQQSILSRPTPGVAFDLRIEYSSANSSSGAQLGSISPYAQGILGSGWQHSFQTALIPAQDFAPEENTDVVGLMRWDGSIETWNLDYTTGEYVTRDGEYNGELAQGITNWTWTTPSRQVYSFFPPDSGPNYVMYGRLISIRDFNGNSVQLHWNQTSGVLTQIVDSVSGTYNFNYHAGLLTNITFNSWSVNFGYNATNQLISKTITNTSGLYGGVNTTWQFAYNTNGLLSQIIDPRGITNVLVQYDQYGRMTNQVDAIGRASATIYGGPGQLQITHIDPASNSWVESYDRKGNILSRSDPFGDMTSYAYDTNDNRISVTEPLGWTTYFGYDNRANVIAKTNALGEVTTWTIHPFFNKPIQQITPQPADPNGLTMWTNSFAYDSGGNLTNQSDALGSLVSYTYSQNGLVLTSTDGNGHISSFGYDTNGFLDSKTDAETNTTTYVLNDVGWKLQEFDALKNPTSYSYNLNGNLTRILDVLGRVYTKTYDPNENLLSASDGKGQLTTYAYDQANQKTNMVDRTGTNKWTYFYTTRGKLDHVTDPLGDSVSNTYDAANRLVQVTDPLGHSITNLYDANGNRLVLFDKLGRRWIKGYDRLDRVVSESDPLGNTRTTAYDVADRVQQITSPNGFPSTDAYDGRGRLIKWIDPMKSSWLYAYDGSGNITNITDANGGHYVMAYGVCNERTNEQNQDGKTWAYTYDALLRLKQQTDPNRTIRTPGYDNASRITSVNFSTGRQDSFGYDNNDNPTNITRRFAGVTTVIQFIYDPLDRVVEQDDALGKMVLYGYDPLGRKTSITYPGGNVLRNSYDVLGRLTNQTDWANRQTTYTYDLQDRLIGRMYPNGIAQSNAFDSAGRILSLNYTLASYASNSINIALTYAYDRSGNKTGGGESGTFNWPLPSLTDDQSSFTPSGRLIKRQITESSPSNSVNTIAYQYDASGNMTNAAGDGQSWALTYDEDNRTTSINWDCGITSKIVTNRYDALGRRISETVDGATSGYVLDLSGGMERVLCDLDGNGNVTAWYVHGPDLCYKVDATNNLTCYHADATGNIIALTGTNGTSLAEYAYTPYGRSLGSTNIQTQVPNPYLFVGSQGVQEESAIPNLYFMRARYYSANAGVFLSTDPEKHIGSGWEPTPYDYASLNPKSNVDPRGAGCLLADVVAFDVGALTDMGYQIYQQAYVNKHGWNFSPYLNGEDVFLSGLKAGAATEAATDVGVVTAGTALATLGPVSAAGLVTDAGAIVQQYADGGFKNVSLAQATIDGDLSSLGDVMTTGMPEASVVELLAKNTASTLVGVGAQTAISSAAQQFQPQTTINQTAASRTPPAGMTANNLSALTSTRASGPSTGSGSTSSSFISITIPRGATLSGLAMQYGTTVANLASLNNISNPNVIYAGATLRVP